MKEKQTLEAIFEKLSILEGKLKDIPTSPPKLLTTEQAADILGIKPNTLKIWRIQGVGPSYIKAEKCVRYSPSDLHNYQDQQKITH